ncbi:hypothetical protein EN871_27905 [bacterium M00.F.Ca.ET.228.01.1.1]|nr:hypothetical protein EN871_27905 [bacterium M00.F.Ca.ET.228.01.1.1]TGR96671.1 hypothetical protein EN834_27085 [bacterium M00.F.Ca.ET.191.01.1.1]TGT97938.1 hypothetical protein EN798_27090 [bacterium M00.F.Ca.ET.155.01.1.1]
MHKTVFLTNNKQEVREVLTGPERRRRWSAEEKLAMVIGASLLKSRCFRCPQFTMGECSTCASLLPAGPQSRRRRKFFF